MPKLLCAKRWLRGVIGSTTSWNQYQPHAQKITFMRYCQSGNAKIVSLHAHDEPISTFHYQGTRLAPGRTIQVVLHGSGTSLPALSFIFFRLASTVYFDRLHI